MQTKIKHIWTAALGAALLLSGCDVTDPIHNTPHPNHGTVTLTTDWSNIGTGLAVPASYTVKVDEYSATLSGTTNTIDNLFTPGSYTAYIYNTAANVTVSGTTATANYAAGDPGWFFTSKLTAAIEADTDHAFTATMAQQVRQLTLAIEPTGGTIARIATITGTLSGAAGSYDMESGAHGTPSNVALTFTKDNSDGKYKATVRLLGTTGNSQKLDITITYNDSSPADQLKDFELNTLLASFNGDKKTPLTLGAQIVETPTPAGFTASILGWDTTIGTGTAD